MVITYALCNHTKCKKRLTCLRFLDRMTNEKAICNFKAICSAKNKYTWYYKNNETKLKETGK